ncbi:hypothetical protein [Rufibacter immobilis]|nr:hypothetical protein [Rufibacter immobilis]
MLNADRNTLDMQVTEKLKTYYHYYQDLKAKGGPEEDTELFETVIELEEDIMSAYGLPPSHDHLQILWQLTEAPDLSEEVLQQTQQQLQETATQHLMAPVKTNLEILQEALEERPSAFNLLPEVGQPTHDYPIFLYEELLLNRSFSPEAILQEMEKIKELDCYGDVATLLYYHRKSYKRTKRYKVLKPHLQFLDLYLQQLEALENNEGHSVFAASLLQKAKEAATVAPQIKQKSASDNIEPSTYLPEMILLTDTLEMEEIVYDQDTAVTVNGKLRTSHGSAPISLGFDREVFIRLLRGYPDQGERLLAYFEKEKKDVSRDSPTIIHVPDTIGNALLASQHYFKVYKPLMLDENGRHKIMEDDFYLVDEVVEKETYKATALASAQEAVEGLLQHIVQSYYSYLLLLQEGISEKKARRNSGLEDPTLFALAQQLYTLQKFGGKPNLG